MNDNVAGSAGALLRAAREKRGLHIAALAAAIKVAPRKLDALENDRWDELPDATFVRALAQTVCRTLKIDAAPVLDRLPPPGMATLEASGGGLNMPFHDRPGREAPGLAVSAIRPMVWAAGLLMLAAGVVYFLPASLWGPRSTASVVKLAALPAASAAVEAPAASMAAAASPPASAAASAAAITVVAAASAASQPQAVPAPTPASTMGLAIASAPAPAPAATVAGLVQLRTSGPSWIDVRDASGEVLLSRIVQSGESVGLNGSPPIRVVIGNATATQLAFRGQVVDLGPRTRDNVARVELP